MGPGYHFTWIFAYLWKKKENKCKRMVSKKYGYKEKTSNRTWQVNHRLLKCNVVNDGSLLFFEKLHPYKFESTESYKGGIINWKKRISSFVRRHLLTTERLRISRERHSGMFRTLCAPLLSERSWLHSGTGLRYGKGREADRTGHICESWDRLWWRQTSADNDFRPDKYTSGV